MKPCIRSLFVGAALALSSTPVIAEPATCPNPQALGTSRDLPVGGDVRIGLKTYPQTLDLADHEVVLTFDDGPEPSTTPRILTRLKLIA